MPKLIDRLPAPVANKLRTRFGKQFVKFAAVAVVSLGASELTLAVMIGPLHMTGGISGLTAAIVGSIVSYFLSRWAWGRKGRPNVWRETIPFWLVSICAWVILSLATKLGFHLAAGESHRFVYHLIVRCHLFRRELRDLCAAVPGLPLPALCRPRPERRRPAGLIETESLSPVTVPASSEDEQNPRQ